MACCCKLLGKCGTPSPIFHNFSATFATKHSSTLNSKRRHGEEFSLPLSIMPPLLLQPPVPHPPPPPPSSSPTYSCFRNSCHCLSNLSPFCSIHAKFPRNSSFLTHDMASSSTNNSKQKSSNLQNPHKFSPPPLQSPPSFLTLPTLLTLGRVASIPLLVTTFYMDNHWGTTATTSIFIIAAITDWLDGYLARRMGMGTAFGAFLDPVADKLMVAATLVLLCSRPMDTTIFGHISWLLTVPSIAIIGREITMAAVREWAASQSSKIAEAVAVNSYGKWKTATQMIALTALLASRDGSLEAGWVVGSSGVVLLYVSSGLAIWSLAVYIRKICKVLMLK